MEVMQNDESQAILSRNDILGENPCNTMTPGKSRCVVKGTASGFFQNKIIDMFSKGLTYCTLNKIHRDDLSHVFQLYPDFAKSFAERFKVTFDLRQVSKNACSFSFNNHSLLVIFSVN